MNEKIAISNILKEPREWFDVKEEKFPDPDQQVVIRICHETMLSGETATEIYPIEDLKVGTYQDGKWTISPPYPKYDYSPLANKAELNEGVNVTHWAVPGETEIEGWNTRFDRIGTYKKLKIEVDPEHEEDVYRALLWGGAFIAQFGGEEFHMAKSGEGLKKLYETLCDLQACIDSPSDNGENNSNGE